MHASAIAADNGLDVRPQPREKCIGRTFEDPPGCLLMPEQHVANDEQPAPLSEGDELVRGRELETIGLRMHGVPLQHVLRTDGVEVSLHDFERRGILARDLGVVERGADEEAPFKNLPEGGPRHGQARALPSATRRRSARSSWIWRLSFFPIE